MKVLQSYPLILLLALTSHIGCTPSASESTGAASDVSKVEGNKGTPAKKTLKDAKATAEKALLAQQPKAAVEVNTVAGPEDVIIVRARDPKAYPGTGVAALIFDPRSGKTFGLRGSESLAKLFVARSWFAKRPDDNAIVHLIHQAYFDGIKIIQKPVVEVLEIGLRVSLPTYSMDGALDQTAVIELRSDGTDSVSSLKPTP